MKNAALFILILVVAAACKKNNDARPLTVSIFSKEALSYVQMPLNRYFIYKDSTTGVTDSVVVTKSDLYMNPNPPVSTGGGGSGYGAGAGYNYHLDTEQVYKLIITIPAGQVKWYDVEAHTSFGVYLGVLNSEAPLAFCGKDNLLPATVDRDSNCYYGFAYSYIGTSTAYPSLAIEGKTYNDVLQVVSTNGLDQNGNEPWYFKSTYSWAKGIGIIKRTVVTSAATTTCTLIRYGQN